MLISCPFKNHQITTKMWTMQLALFNQSTYLGNCYRGNPENIFHIMNGPLTEEKLFIMVGLWKIFEYIQIHNTIERLLNEYEWIMHLNFVKGFYIFMFGLLKNCSRSFFLLQILQLWVFTLFYTWNVDPSLKLFFKGMSHLLLSD